MKIKTFLYLPPLGMAGFCSAANATVAAASQVPEPSVLGLFAAGTVAGILIFFINKRK